MERRRARGALKVAATIAVGGAIAGVLFWLASTRGERNRAPRSSTDQPPTSQLPTVEPAPPPPPPPPTKEQTQALQQLAVRTDAFSNAGATDIATLTELVAAAEQLSAPAVDGLDGWLNLLASLGFCTTCCSNYGDVRAPAARLASLYAGSLALLRNRQLPASVHRNYAELCLHAGDMARLAQAIDGGLAVLADAEPLERAQLLAFACRLHCLLGRLDAAAHFSGRAMRAAEDSVAAAQQVRDPNLAAWAQSAAANCLRNAAFAAADLHLLDGDFDSATYVLRQLPADDGAARFYLSLIAAMQGDQQAEQHLATICSGQRLPPSLSSLACPKLIQAALLRDDDDAAIDRFTTFAERRSETSDDRHGHWSTLAIELALRDRIDADAALRDRARTALRSLLDRWRAAPQLPGGIGFLHLDDRATLLANLLRLEAKLVPSAAGEAGLQLVLAAHQTSSDLDEAIDADAIRSQLLGERHGLLVLVPGRYASVLLIVDADGVHFRPLAPAAELRRMIDDLRAASASFLAETPNSEAKLQTTAAAVAEALLPDELPERLRSWHRLTICGAGLLQNVPFDLLPFEVDGRTTRLGRHLAIDYVPNLVAAMRQPPARMQGPALVAASLLTTAAGAKPYRMPPELIRACTAPYRAAGQPHLAWTDGGVRVAAIVAKLSTARIAHLVAHGLQDARRTYAHGMAFADGSDGVLWGERVVDLDLDGLVVMLSSCRAGDAPWRRGGDPMAASLAGAMLAAGARCVLVPTTEVRLQRHLQAMAQIHRQLADGQPPAVALHAARRTQAADDVDGIELLLVQVHGRGF